MYYSIYNIDIVLNKYFECRSELFSNKTTKFIFHAIITNESGETVNDIEFNAPSFEERRRWMDALNRSTKKVELKYRSYI